MIDLEITYNIDFERKRVEAALNKKDWYDSHNYKITLPEHSIEEEFDLKIYESYKNYIENKWKEYISNLDLKKLPFSFNKNYKIILTRYGVGGSYNSKTGEIIINISQRSEDVVLGTIVHEMIHILIEPLIVKYKIKHWEKERLVDLICIKYFSDIRKPQNIKEDVSVVDKAFESFFPDIENVIRYIA